MLQDRRDPVKIVGNKKTIQIKISGVRVEWRIMHGRISGASRKSMLLH
jgi:hypothetical protein